jgi:hypothetical protein
VLKCELQANQEHISRRDVAVRISIWAWGNTKAAVEIKALATTLPLEGSDVGWFEAPEALGTGELTLQKGKDLFHSFFIFLPNTTLVTFIYPQ